MSQYTTNTVTVINGSAVVTGLNTKFLTEVLAGNTFKKKSENVIYAIGSVDSNTQITLAANYTGSGESGAEYQIGRDFTPNFSLDEINSGDLDWPVHLTHALRIIDTYLYMGSRFETATGSANAYVLTPTIAIAAYVSGLNFNFIANFTNTGAATVNISGLGAKSIKKFHDKEVVSGDIESGQIVSVVYNSVEGWFQITSQLAQEQSRLRIE